MDRRSTQMLVLCFVVFLGACQREPPQTEAILQQTALSVKAARTPLRESPGENGKVLRELEKGAVLRDMGEVSDFMTRLTVQGQPFYEPWLKVEAGDGTPGWVYAAALDFGSDTLQLSRKRLQAMLGKTLFEQAMQWSGEFKKAENQKELAASYLKSMTLRDSMVRDLPGDDGASALPDLFWIKTLLPAFEPQLVAEGTAYYLFADYKVWLKKAAQTQEKEDDAFFQFCIQTFPEDSIEYFYPAWFMQTWDYGGSSLLGRGIHLRLLEAANRLCTTNTPYRSEILRIKAEIINDITRDGVDYWEQPDKIMRELDSILERHFEILDAADQIALSTRRTHFEDPGANGIKTGLGAGIEN